MGSLFASNNSKNIDIFIYGHSTSGKSTLIQKSFTLGDEELISTEDFSYYEFDRELGLGHNSKVRIRIADYRGQKPVQFLEELKLKTRISALIFIVDVAPAYNSMGVKYTDNEIYALMSKDPDNVLRERVRDHEKYMNEFLLQIVFQFAMSKDLKSIYLLINKVDILEHLQRLGVIDKEIIIEDYAKSFFFSIADEIKKFCSHNNINDFKVVCVSAREYKNTASVFKGIINKQFQNH
ncbi:MAG: GTPase domain-containing protein [Bacteroidia bacterium]